MTDTCETCRFWRPNTKRQKPINGECRIRAAQVVADANGGLPLTAWPYTLHDEWCGEHQPKPIDNTGDTEGNA